MRAALCPKPDRERGQSGALRQVRYLREPDRRRPSAVVTSTLSVYRPFGRRRRLTTPALERVARSLALTNTLARVTVDPDGARIRTRMRRRLMHLVALGTKAMRLMATV
jgi:hypothetical protein